MKLYDHSFQKQGMDNEKYPNCPSSFIFHQIKKTLPDNNDRKYMF